MISRFKKETKVVPQKTNKREFLLEHNKLSPLNLQATIPLLSSFKAEKASLFKNVKDDDWSIDKLRRPFIMWLTSCPSKEQDNARGRQKEDE